MDAPLKSIPIRLDVIKRRAVQIYEDANACGRAYSRDVAIAALLPSLEWAKAHAIPAELAHTIVIDAWVAEGRKRILNWDVRSVGTLNRCLSTSFLVTSKRPRSFRKSYFSTSSLSVKVGNL